ncbi:MULTISPECIES: hypothetical protein [unclassified Brenneria]|uniref:hypothetical protein n=1 Tax=unclassified Brenneria TaxID=2634434 RepID=UPI0015540CB6|nr:hypothetical protein [Brenneria sp. hezel4-2-4]MEE3652637.1 hypothetical protein [Brenneria sp. HEZEL_4_2_4]NPD02595.1 hypothetical protein [Brenneria sp. hezel4-2-4]
MSILTMRRFWIAVSLPLFVAWFFSSGALILLWWLWLPISAPLLIWAFLTYRRDKKEEAEAELARANYLNRQKKEITTPKFEFMGITYTFEKTFSGTVIDVCDDQHIWAKSDDGVEKRFKIYDVHFRKGHYIRRYAFVQYFKDGAYRSINNALIINDSINNREISEFSEDLYTPSSFAPALTILFIILFISFFVWAFTLNYGYVILSALALIYILRKITKRNSQKFNSEVQYIANRLEK